VFRPQRNFQYDLADSELKICRSHEESERNKLEKLQEAIKNTEATIKQRTEEVAQLKRKIPLTENSLRGAHEELEGVKREEAQITKEIRQKRMHLEEVRSSMQMSRSRGKILDSLMQQKREGKCRGLYGRLVMSEILLCERDCKKKSVYRVTLAPLTRSTT
jgi:structural maintenance of chromosome 4